MWLGGGLLGIGFAVIFLGSVSAAALRGGGGQVPPPLTRKFWSAIAILWVSVVVYTARVCWLGGSSKALLLTLAIAAAWFAARSGLPLRAVHRMRAVCAR